MKIKKGDKVKVITGKDKNKVGIVTTVLKKSMRLVVEGVNIVKRHKKSSSQDKPKGIISFEAPIHMSNVMLVDPKTDKTTRIGYKMVDDKKVRITKKSNSEIK